MGVSNSSGSVSANSTDAKYTGPKPIQDPYHVKNKHYFEPTYNIAWLIGNTDYSNVRMATGIPTWKDITQAYQDVSQMNELFTEMNFDLIMRTENGVCEDLEKGYRKICDEMSNAKSNKKKTLLYVYYSGHGNMDTTTKIICNVSESFYRYWDLENRLSILSKYPNTFVVGVLDCCREAFN